MRDWRFWTLHLVKFALVFGAMAVFAAFAVIFRFRLNFVSGIAY